MKILYVTTVGSTMGFFYEHFKMLIDVGNEIELEYGQSLTWQRLTDKVTCRIKDEREFHCFDIDNKTEIFSFLKNASEKMSVIFHNYIIDYKA